MLKEEDTDGYFRTNGLTHTNMRDKETRVTEIKGYS